MSKTNKIPVSVGIPFDLLISIEQLAKEQQLSRSEFIVNILKEKIEQKAGV